MRKTKLGVNIDHIATLRQARRESFPDPVELAQDAVAGGADGIVCHLREDRRHIQDNDVWRLKRKGFRLDLEMAATNEMLLIALKIKPAMSTIVPEKRQEITTEGGLDLFSGFKQIKKVVSGLETNGTAVSLFIDPDARQIQKAAESGASFIEIHTGAYANAKTAAGKQNEIKKIVAAVKLAHDLGLKVNAGHGIDYQNVVPILKIDQIVELNIGFSIIARAVKVGLKQAVSEMKQAIRG